MHSTAYRLIAAALMSGFFMSAAWPHSWYDPYCCSDRDCAEIDSSRVKITANGYLVDGKFVVPYASARRSQNSKYHACFPTPRELRCLYAPPGAV